MSRAQQLVLAVGLFAVLAAAAYPPWRYAGAYTPSDTYDMSAGHGFVLAPPEVDYSVGGRVPPNRLRVDAGLLLAEVAAIASVTGLILTGLGCCCRRATNLRLSP